MPLDTDVPRGIGCSLKSPIEDSVDSRSARPGDVFSAETEKIATPLRR
jgi:hypothetical protein